MNMASPILVTGALGNVGTEIIKRLQAEGRGIRAADIDVEKMRARFGSSVEAVHFDFAQPRSYQQAFSGVEKMFLMRPPHIADVKRLMFPALDAAKLAGVKHVVFLSLIGIEKAKFLPHYKVEKYLKTLDLQTTFLRCSFFMQNLSTTHRKEIKEFNEIFVPVGNARTSFIDVRDIGEVAAATLTKPGHGNKNYDLTGSESLDYWQVVKILSAALGRDITYRNPGPLRYFIDTVRSGAPLVYALVTMLLYTSTRFGMADVVTQDVEKLLHRKPISFKQFVQDHKSNWI
jgi:uncharacterized protein YbjT (DUF2867 family)